MLKNSRGYYKHKKFLQTPNNICVFKITNLFTLCRCIMRQLFFFQVVKFLQGKCADIKFLHTLQRMLFYLFIRETCIEVRLSCLYLFLIYPEDNIGYTGRVK